MGVPYAEVIGDPIAHSKSPTIHKFWLDKLGLDGDYRAVRVRPEELGDYLLSRRADPDWRGCNVTAPHKQKIIPLLDSADDFEVGAVNVVLPGRGRLVGKNTDGAGIDEAFSGGIETGLPICIIGAGGAAKAAISSLDVLAVHRFHVIVRNQAQGHALIEPYQDNSRVFAFAEATEALFGCVGAINASPLGMAGCAAMPANVLDGLVGIERGGFVFDMVYVPIATELLMRARRVGLEAVDGLTMLVGQAAHAFWHFFGVEAPRRYDAELRSLLTS